MSVGVTSGSQLCLARNVPAVRARSLAPTMALLDKVLGRKAAEDDPDAPKSDYYDSADNAKRVAVYMERVARINALEDDVRCLLLEPASWLDLSSLTAPCLLALAIATARTPGVDEPPPWQIELLDDDALAAKTGELRRRLQQGESEEDILEDAFAVRVRLRLRRRLRLRLRLRVRLRVREDILEDAFAVRGRPYQTPSGGPVLNL